MNAGGSPVGTLVNDNTVAANNDAKRNFESFSAYALRLRDPSNEVGALNIANFLVPPNNVANPSPNNGIGATPVLMGSGGGGPLSNPLVSPTMNGLPNTGRGRPLASTSPNSIIFGG